MKTRHLPWLIALPGLLGGCDPSSTSSETESIFERYLMLPSDVHQDELEAAISCANAFLKGQVPFRLAGQWQDDDAQDLIRVLLIRPVQLGKWGPAFCLRDERVIIVDDSEIEAFRQRHLPKGMPSFALIPVEYLLAIVLLHEAGHIYLGHTGAFEATNFAYGNVTKWTQSKEVELEADRFVGRLIREYRNGHSMADANLLYTFLWLGAIQARLIVDRLDRDESINPPPEYFLDPGYSHPNMEMRVVTILSIAYPEYQQSNLEAFNDQRKEAIRQLDARQISQSSDGSD